jgi:hypothetical protein
MSKTPFIESDATTGIKGTRVRAAFLNALNTHYHDGVDADGHGALPYAAAAGTLNAYVVTLSPALEAYIVGMPICFKASAANTGAATLNINGLGIKQLKKRASVALEAGDIYAGMICQVVYDGEAFQLLNPSDYVIQAAVANFISNNLNVLRRIVTPDIATAETISSGYKASSYGSVIADLIGGHNGNVKFYLNGAYIGSGDAFADDDDTNTIVIGISPDTVVTWVISGQAFASVKFCKYLEPE